MLYVQYMIDIIEMKIVEYWFSPLSVPLEVPTIGIREGFLQDNLTIGRNIKDRHGLIWKFIF